jgi:DNA-binding transcriptional MerR regulator
MEQKVFRSGELARLTGISTDLLRHYERIGVLAHPPRDTNGYRVHSAGSLDRVLVVQRALRAGFSLAELTRILGQRDLGRAPCRMVHSLARQKIRALGEQIRSLQELRRFLQRLTRDWSSRLRKTPPGRKAYLLDSLATRDVPVRSKEPRRMKGRNRE